MTVRKPLQIDAEMHRRVGEEAKRWGMSQKVYAEQCLSFFAMRGIDPSNYSPGQAFDVVQVMKKSTDRIISFMKHQEQTLLSDITEEMLRSRLYQDALVLLMVEKLVPSGEQDQRLSEITTYVEGRIKEAKKADAH